MPPNMMNVPQMVPPPQQLLPPMGMPPQMPMMPPPGHMLNARERSEFDGELWCANTPSDFMYSLYNVQFTATSIGHPNRTINGMHGASETRNANTETGVESVEVIEENPKKWTDNQCRGHATKIHLREIEIGDAIETGIEIEDPRDGKFLFAIKQKLRNFRCWYFFSFPLIFFKLFFYFSVEYSDRSRSRERSERRRRSKSRESSRKSRDKKKSHKKDKDDSE